MANDKQETLDQAVSRIADELMHAETSVSASNVIDRTAAHRKVREAALRKMAAWQRERDAEIVDREALEYEEMATLLADTDDNIGRIVNHERARVAKSIAAAIRKGE